MVPDEAWDLWEQAAEYLEQESATERDLKDAASLLHMAVDYSTVPFPEAHALLAIVYSKLKNYQLAVTHADLTMRDDPYNHMAQSVKVRVALLDLKAFNPRAFLRSESWLNVLIGGVALKKTGDSQNNLRKEVEIWLKVFTALAKEEGYTCKDYVWMGSEIIEIADIIPGEKTGLTDLVREMYLTVSTVNTSHLAFQEQSEMQEAKRLNLLARGRAKL